MTLRRDQRLWAEHLRVADDLWFIAHDDRTGKPRVSPVALDCGLAGALVGELVLSRNIQVRDGRIHVLTGKLPDDAATLEILENMLAEPHHDVRTWLTYLSQNATTTVTNRLVRNGMLEPQETRRLLKTVIVYRPTDLEGAFWRSGRLEAALAGKRGQTTWGEIFLGGLLGAVGMLQLDLWDDGPRISEFVHGILAKADPSLREITATVHSLIGEAVLRMRH
ncbi:GOLPH3/VPS74 family protein [Fodinicola acaciae]|uniref:GOLPH3/VPS74 family protein n=1 Tax=Fodinicola acaciae TaxID=2681555 RepID=UPI0013D04B5B|nr:GPP34 family phosphoprotein [Fodinicola acaciae]